MIAVSAIVTMDAQTTFVRDPKIAIDEEYTKKVKEYTTQPYFTSPLVDYLPASKTIPTPKAVLGDVAGAPGKLPYAEEVYQYMRMPMQSRFAQGRRRLMPIGRSSQTNDIGEYRIFGLAPGDYFVSATLRNFNGGDSDDHTGYAPTYYPGTANGAEAQRVSLAIGQSVSEINITLVATRTAKITGTVTDSQGRPVAQGFVNAMPRQAGGMFFGPGGGGPVRDGTFTLSGVAPGDYTLRANIGNNGGAGRPEFATANVTVNGEDISGVRLLAMSLITATGRVVFQDPSAAQSLRARININTSPINPDDQMMMMGGGNTTVNDDYTFELRVPPGRMRVFAGVSNPGWALHAVRLNGVDVTDTGIDFTPGGDFSAIEIELTNRVSELSGVVTNARNEVTKDYTVLVFSQDRDDWTMNTRHRSQGRPDQEGRFRIRALPAGRYYAIALDSVDPNESGDPDFLDRLRQRATMADTVVVTMSEFGRALQENGNRGTDHGHGNAMMVIGGGARGGRVYGKWPGLAVEHRYDRRDLAITTDFRDVFSEIVVRHLGLTDARSVFPGYAVAESKFPGIFA